MKAFLLLITFFISNITSLESPQGVEYSEGIIVVYQVRSKADIKKAIIDNPQMKTTFKAVEKIISEAQFELIIDGKFSKFSKVEALLSDHSSMEQIAADITLNADDNFYIDLDKKTLFHQPSRYGKGKLVQMDFNDNPWDLLTDSKKIGDYHCYKAKRIVTQINGQNEVITAWYTPEINYSHGPKGSYGLPGLILELEDDKLIYTVTNIKFKENVTVAYPKNLEVISIEEAKNLFKIEEARANSFLKN